ncbi:hypothetical protein [Ktedonobacter racemifer]|nr:hypothetical protein [Ktedonobacter racemifer]
MDIRIFVQADEGSTDQHISAALSFLAEEPSLRGTSLEACALSGEYYRRPHTQGDRMIAENDWQILQIFTMSDDERRGPDGYEK